MSVKTKTTQSIKAQTDKDLEKAVLEKREALRESRFGVAGAKAKDVRVQRNIRRDIARMLTELTHRTQAAK